jgi:DNA-binding NtrC family response regulator
MEINNKLQALIIDDEIDICFLLTHILKNRNISSKYVNSLVGARELLNVYLPQIIFLDNHLPDGLGIDFIKHIKSLKLDTKIILITAHDKFILKEKALQEGASEFISKPFAVEKIYSVVEKLKESYELRTSNYE